MSDFKSNSEMTFEDYQRAIKLKAEYEKLIKLQSPKSRDITPFTDWCKHKAVFFDDKGLFLGMKGLNYKEKYFYYKDGAYNFIPSKSSFIKVKCIFRNVKYYFYYINNPNPIVLDKKCVPILDSVPYKTILESDLVKKLNPKKSRLLELLNFKVIIIILVIIAVIYYFVSGGTLT